MNYYPRFPGDYMKKTMHLSMVEDGAYCRLLDWYYANDKPIPDAKRYAITRATCAAERAAVDAVLGEFFHKLDGSHHNERADEEIIATAKRIAAAKENGSKGGRKPKHPANPSPNNNPPGNPVGSDPVKRIESSPTPDSLRSGDLSEAKASSSSALPTTFEAANDSLGGEGPDDDPRDLCDIDDNDDDERLPPCPHRRLIAMWRDRCPELACPRVETWVGANEKAMRARWRFILTETREDGSRYAETPEQAVEWFGRLFDSVRDSDFLYGRTATNFVCDLGWLMKLANFNKVLNKNYVNRPRRSAP